MWTGSSETRCWVQGSTVGPVSVPVTPARITSTATPVTLTRPPTRSSVTANKDTLVVLHFFFGDCLMMYSSTEVSHDSNLTILVLIVAPKGPAVTSVSLATMATRSRLAGSACRASATATSTPRTLIHVTPGPASASSASTTPTACPAPSVNTVTTATLWPTTAGVSDDSRC